MNITLARKDDNKEWCIHTKTLDEFIEAIAHDDEGVVAGFRENPPVQDGWTKYFEGVNQWWHVYPDAEFEKSSDGKIVYKACNGVLTLVFGNLLTDKDIQKAKKIASLLPMTYAAFKGADGQSLVVLVKIAEANEMLSETEAMATIRCSAAYERAKFIYQPLMNGLLLDDNSVFKFLNENFLMTFDDEPYYNKEAVVLYRVTDIPKQNANLQESLASRKIEEAYEVEMKRLLLSRYVFRYDAGKNSVEYRHNNTNIEDFLPVTDNVVFQMFKEVILADIDVKMEDILYFMKQVGNGTI